MCWFKAFFMKKDLNEVLESEEMKNLYNSPNEIEISRKICLDFIKGKFS